MTMIKSHDCKMCGGPLEIDLDRQVYRCPFCGISYDYEYFREDNVMEVAKTAISRGEFGAATDAYEFMLNKDPHNFEALLGLILCKCKWRTIQPIIYEKKVHIKEDDPTLVRALENCLPERKEFFEKIRDALKVLSEYRSILPEISALENDRTSENHLLGSLQEAKAANARKFVDMIASLREYKDSKGQTVFDIVVFFVFIALVALTAYIGWVVPIVAAVIIIAYAVTYNVMKRSEDKRYEAAIAPHAKNIAELSELCRQKREEAEKLRLEYESKAKEIAASVPED